MKRHLIKAGLLAIAAAGFCGTAAADWSKTYVVEWNEPAMYFGGAKDAGVIDPGTDCPKGTNGEPKWIDILVKSGYTPVEAAWLRSPDNPTRSPVHGQNQMAFRGKDRANVYVNPTSTPDPGLQGVTGKIGEGIDLDGNATNGFTSPTGEKGIDNEFYRTLGCWKTYRAQPRLSSGALTFNDSMQGGAWTTVIVVAGKGADPMNDGDVQIGMYLSADKMVKDGNGAITRDFTFRIKPDQKLEALFAAKTVNGQIVSTAASDEVWLRDPSYAQQLQLLKAKVSFKMEPDGSLKGYVGGYRPWEPVYRGWVNARGPVIESLTWVQLPSVYYALRRSADYSPTGPGGEKTHISFALRVEAVPAFVVSPDAKDDVTKVTSYKVLAAEIAAKAPPPAARPAGGFGVTDGLVPDPRVPFGKSLEIFPPPVPVAQATPAAAPTASPPAAARGGGGN